MTSSLPLLIASILLHPRPSNATSLLSSHVTTTRSSSAIHVHSPSEAEVQDISHAPQLTFKPIGDIKTIVAFARLQATVDIEEVITACSAASASMRGIWTLAPPDTRAHQYVSDTPLIARVFEATRLELHEACDNLKNWDQPENFFTEQTYPHRRSAYNNATATPDDILLAAYRFGTAQPDFRNQPNSTSADATDTVKRAEPFTVASVIIGGSMLLISLYNLLFGGSTPTWSQEAATEKIAHGAWSSAQALQQLCGKIKDVYHFDEFMNYVNGARDNAKDLINLINDIRRGIFQLLIGNISPVFITALNLQAALDNLQSEASVHHLRLSVRSAADVVQMPAFGIRDNGTLRVVVPIPIASDTLAAHEFAGTPLLSGSPDDGYSLITPQPPYSCIAVDGSSSNHILFNQGDLSNCFRVHKTFMCPEFPVRTNRQASCIGALFTANTDSVKDRCVFISYRETWHMSRASRGTFIFATSTATSATTSCPQGHSRSVPLQPGIYRLSVPPGCTTMTPDVSVTAAYTDFAQVDIRKTLDWSPTQAAAYKRNLSAFDNLQRHASHAAATIHEGIVLSRSAHQTPWWHHAAWGAALIIAIAVVVGFVVYRFRGVASAIASVTTAVTAYADARHRRPADPEPVVKYRAPQPPVPGQAIIAIAPNTARLALPEPSAPPYAAALNPKLS